MSISRQEQVDALAAEYAKNNGHMPLAALSPTEQQAYRDQADLDLRLAASLAAYREAKR